MTTNQPLRPTPSSGVCSVCGKESHNILRSALDQTKTICIKCVHVVSVAMDLKEDRAIECLKCKNTKGFFAVYEGAKPAKAHFSRHEENDEEDVPVYRLDYSTGLWNSSRMPTRFKCDKCDGVIYHFVPFTNPYVKNYLPEKPTT